ncbi:MAG: hypothetical protein JW701_00575 [Kosmotogaceae bacterium]|nr:hypothetical protein [Kosmotogaceae bacterium]
MPKAKRRAKTNKASRLKLKRPSKKKASTKQKRKRVKKGTGLETTSVFAYVTISVFLVLFYALAIFDSIYIQRSILFIAALFFVEGLYAFKRKIGHDSADLVLDLVMVVAIVSAAIVTFVISVNGGGPVVAAAGVGLAFSYLAEKASKRFKDPVYSNLSAPVYCGAFVGMSFELIFTNVWMVALAGLVAGLVYVISDGVYEGAGGKLGTVAFIGSLVAKFMLFGLK